MMSEEKKKEAAEQPVITAEPVVDKWVEEEKHWNAAWHHFERWYRGRVDEWVSETKAERLEYAVGKLDEDNILELLSGDALLDEVNEHVDEWLHESIDGCAEVIYTNKAKVVLLVSGNEDAYAEEIGEAPPNVHIQAFMALRADILEGLD
jgi:hypothetical protein